MFSVLVNRSRNFCFLARQLNVSQTPTAPSNGTLKVVLNNNQKKLNTKEVFIYYSSPEHWFQTALELDQTILELLSIKDKSYYLESYHLHSKNVQRSFCSKSIYLLMTFAIENLIKGILVLRNPDFVNSGTLKKEIKTHDLTALSIEANLNLLVREKKLLTKLTHIGLSTARYPIGLNEHFEIIPVEFIKNDENTYNKLFIKLRDKLAKEFNRKGWDSGTNNPKLKTNPGEFRFMINKNYG